MADKPLVEGEYLLYKEKPFVHEANTYCYGDMTDDFVLVLTVNEETDTKMPNGETIKTPSKVNVQILSTDVTKNPIERIVKQTEKKSLYEAMDIGLIWLEKMNTK